MDVLQTCDWVTNSDWSAAALHRIPPGTDAAHPPVIAVDYLQRCMVRLRSWHQRGPPRIWPRWFTERVELALAPPNAGGGFQLSWLPVRSDFAATPFILDQEFRRRAHV